MPKITFSIALLAIAAPAFAYDTKQIEELIQIMLRADKGAPIAARLALAESNDPRITNYYFNQIQTSPKRAEEFLALLKSKNEKQLVAVLAKLVFEGNEDALHEPTAATALQVLRAEIDAETISLLQSSPLSVKAFDNALRGILITGSLGTASHLIQWVESTLESTVSDEDLRNTTGKNRSDWTIHLCNALVDMRYYPGVGFPLKVLASKQFNIDGDGFKTDDVRSYYVVSTAARALGSLAAGSPESLPKATEVLRKLARRTYPAPSNGPIFHYRYTGGGGLSWACNKEPSDSLDVEAYSAPLVGGIRGLAHVNRAEALDAVIAAFSNPSNHYESLYGLQVKLLYGGFLFKTGNEEDFLPFVARLRAIPEHPQMNWGKHPEGTWPKRLANNLECWARK